MKDKIFITISYFTTFFKIVYSPLKKHTYEGRNRRLAECW